MIRAPENTRTRLRKLPFRGFSRAVTWSSAPSRWSGPRTGGPCYVLVLSALLLVNVHVLAGPPAEPDQIAEAGMQLIRTHCIDCHNPKKKKGALLLDTREAMLAGGSDGVVVVPGDHKKSRMFTYLHADADPHMPPKKQLSDEALQTMARWVDAGAPWDAKAFSSPLAAIPDVKPQPLPDGYAPSLAMAIYPDGAFAAIGSGTHIKIYDLKADKQPLIHELTGHTDLVRSLAFSPDKQWLVSGSSGAIHVWDTNEFALQNTLDAPRGRVNALAFYGSTLWAADDVNLHTWKNFEDHQKWAAHEDEIYTLLSTSNRVLSAGADAMIKVWDPESHKLIRVLEGHTDYVNALAISPDGKTLATAGVDRGVGIWEVDSGVQTHTVEKYPAAIVGLTWSKEGKYILAVDVKGQMHRAEATSKSPNLKTGASEAEVTQLVSGFEAGSAYTISRSGQAHRWEDSGKVAPAFGAAQTNIPSKGLSFVYDILPIFTKHGCATSECHARQGGQKGFHLSIFSYDKRADYAEVTRDGMIRRLDPTRPAASLILLKPTKALAHEGGQRFDPDSFEARTIRDWIAQGMPYQVAGEPELTGLEVEPLEHTYRKGQYQALKVTAQYADGRKRDVTRLATFATNDKAIASVNDQGKITAKIARGETAIIARFMGEVGISRVLIPPEKILPEDLYAALPEHNLIDGLAWKRHRALGLLASGACDDATFLRRASLDIIGRLPSVDEARSFLGAPDRTVLVERLLADPQYADYWAIKWADLVRPNPERAGLKSVLVIDQWLRDCFRENLPYDAFVRQILTATGSTHADGPTVIYRDRREPADRTTMFSQVFMGVRLECARCHQHPNEKWSMKDFYQMAAFFRSVQRKGQGVSPPISGLPEYFWFAPGGSVEHPVTGETMALVPPDGEVLNVPDDQDPRIALADWMTRPDNPFLARAIVNRVWAEFFGLGFVNPVDDFRASNPASNSELLDALAQDFVRQGYDLKQLIRTITASALYQRDGAPNEHNLDDDRHFTRALRRRVSAEVLADMLADISEVTDIFESLPPGSRAMQTWNFKFSSDLLDAFGRPDISADPPCERDRGSTLVQALHVMHSDVIQRKLHAQKGRCARLAKLESNDEVIEDLYLACFSRHPRVDEFEIARSAFNVPNQPRQEAIEDLLWALMNTAEFVFNH
ncbi:MAG: mono/diheme cytochrome c family protein [Candidatus Omnitrophota bacterium]|jgi:mono/diheme cytochrome c family protein